MLLLQRLLDTSPKLRQLGRGSAPAKTPLSVFVTVRRIEANEHLKNRRKPLQSLLLDNITFATIEDSLALNFLGAY